MSERGDVIDRANERAAQIEEAAVEEVRRQARLIEAGAPGVCDLCGAWSGRLVGGACAPCRDKHGLP